MSLVSKILSKDFDGANEHLAEAFQHIMKKKLLESKKRIAAKIEESDEDTAEEPATNRPLKIAGRTTTPGSQSFPTNPDYQERMGHVSDVVGIAAGLGSSGPAIVKGAMTAGKILAKTGISSTANEETEEQLDEARIGIVSRIRNGKVQRRKKVSLVQGMTMRGGKLTRMSPAERRRRKLGARRAKIKVRAKRNQMLRKRKLSIAKRQRLGL